MTVMTRMQLVELEESIKQEMEYLHSYIAPTEIETVLSKIETILDFGLSNDKIKNFFKTNRKHIEQIDKLLKDKDESFAHRG